jgi:hypothetical protein
VAVGGVGAVGAAVVAAAFRRATSEGLWFECRVPPGFAMDRSCKQSRHLPPVAWISRYVLFIAN